jgi:voltage-gated potassium channel
MMNILSFLNIDRKLANFLLLANVLFCALILPLISNNEYFEICRRISFSLLLVFSLLVVVKIHNGLSLVALCMILIQWLADFMNWHFISDLLKTVTVLLFIFTVVNLIFQIAKVKSISLIVIMEAVNGYLLLGLLFTLLVQLLVFMDPYAYATTGAASSDDLINHEGTIYYAYTAMTTVGYGDIVPVSPAARSLSILISVSGQLYLTAILALIVGKFANLKYDEN